MTDAKIIIGSAFGDEGKGLFTDHLCSKDPTTTCVVRFNGGAQAGHTVQLTDGTRHVFSHFGSGSLLGAPTYLSSFVVTNPIIFLRESKELAICGVAQPKLFADPFCPITTPYDIMINQIVEEVRGANRHGSVGIGFGETLERHGHAPFSLVVREIEHEHVLRDKLDIIRKQWVPKRLAQLGVTNIPEVWVERFASEVIRDRFMEDCAYMLGNMTLKSLPCLHSYDHLVFEGAQGLLLDQDHGWFPHVTRSNTGLKNVVNLTKQLRLKEIDVYYLTRTYTTRHGAGPLPHELPEQPYTGIVDKTNKPNPYQGTLRFAWLDLDLFRNTVTRDIVENNAGLELRPHLAMSCMDQVDGKAQFIENGELRSESVENLLDRARRSINGQTALASFGPTRNTIQTVTPKPRRAPSFSKCFEFVESMNVTLSSTTSAVT